MVALAMATRSEAADASDFATLYRVIKPSVVLIVAATDSGGQSGSGFVYKSGPDSSIIVTANHVIEGASKIDVIFDSSEQERYPAEVVNHDAVKDVAILRVPIGHRRALTLAEPSHVLEGMPIALIGYPRATLSYFRRIEGDDLRPSVHEGIISAIRLNGEIVQFDATADHGDSGGPVVDVKTGRVVCIVRGAPLDTSYSSRGLEETLPGSEYGPSAATIASVTAGQPITSTATTAASSSTPGNSGRVASNAANSASFRVGYGVPHEEITAGSAESGSEINESVETSALDRLTTFLKSDNSLYLIPVQLTPDSVSTAQSLSDYCDDNRLNAIAAPLYSWSLTGGPRYNVYGTLLGYNGTASVTVDFFVFDCFGIPFFAEQKTKSENRYFAHRTPDREVVDMANDLLDQLMADFATSRTQRAAAWMSLLKTGIAIDPADNNFHSLLSFNKKPAGWQVTVIVPNGPAQQAGIQVQDIILRINGTDVTGASASDIAAMMNAPTYTIDVQRPGGTATLTVHPLRYQDIVNVIRH
jgi:S1-C subfamily serine protease